VNIRLPTENKLPKSLYGTTRAVVNGLIETSRGAFKPLEPQRVICSEREVAQEVRPTAGDGFMSYESDPLMASQDLKILMELHC